MRIAMLALALTLAISGPVTAGPFEDGMAAYDRQDYVLAVQWFRKAADQGNDNAQFLLGVMYRNGEGVPQDYALSVLWFRKAADQGDASAQFNLGAMYHVGLGVPKDYTLAYMWANLAAAGAPGRAQPAYLREMAQKARDATASRMTPAQIGEAQRLSREWKPTGKR